MSTVKPILLALVLCDTTIKDAATGKLSLIGTFNGIFSNNFPCVHPTLSVYVALTELRGKVQCKLRMISPSNGIVFDLPGQIEGPGPTSIAEIVFQLPGIRFETTGSYSVEFWAGSELLGSRKLNAQKMEPNRAQE